MMRPGRLSWQGSSPREPAPCRLASMAGEFFPPLCRCLRSCPSAEPHGVYRAGGLLSRVFLSWRSVCLSVSGGPFGVAGRAAASHRRHMACRGPCTIGRSLPPGESNQPKLTSRSVYVKSKAALAWRAVRMRSARRACVSSAAGRVLMRQSASCTDACHVRFFPAKPFRA